MLFILNICALLWFCFNECQIDVVFNIILLTYTNIELIWKNWPSHLQRQGIYPYIIFRNFHILLNKGHFFKQYEPVLGTKPYVEFIVIFLNPSISLFLYIDIPKSVHFSLFLYIISIFSLLFISVLITILFTWQLLYNISFYRKVFSMLFCYSLFMLEISFIYYYHCDIHLYISV